MSKDARGRAVACNVASIGHRARRESARPRSPAEHATRAACGPDRATQGERTEDHATTPTLDSRLALSTTRFHDQHAFSQRLTEYHAKQDTPTLALSRTRARPARGIPGRPCRCRICDMSYDYPAPRAAAQTRKGDEPQDRTSPNRPPANWPSYVASTHACAPPRASISHRSTPACLLAPPHRPHRKEPTTHGAAPSPRLPRHHDHSVTATSRRPPRSVATRPHACTPPLPPSPPPPRPRLTSQPFRPPRLSRLSSHTPIQHHPLRPSRRRPHSSASGGAPACPAASPGYHPAPRRSPRDSPAVQEGRRGARRRVHPPACSGCPALVRPARRPTAWQVWVRTHRRRRGCNLSWPPWAATRT